MDFQLFLIVLSVIVTGGLAINAHLSESKKEKELKDKTEEIIMLQKKLTEKSEETIQKQNDLIREQKENKIISKDILKFQGKLDSNTTAISRISKEISKVSTNTNQISNIIKDEQRQKGKVEFKTEDYEYYFVDFGMVSGLQKKSDLQREETNYINGIPFTMLIENDKFLVSLSIRDKDGNLIFDLKRGEWAINKNVVFSVNYDSLGIEVIDVKGGVILQIDLIKNRFNVSGTFYENDGVTLVHPQLFAKVLYSDKNYDFRLKEFQYNIKRIFVHHGEDYLGKRLK